MKTYSREELIDICERAVVLEEHWHDRDSASAHLQLGQAWVLLKAGCIFQQLDGDTSGSTSQLKTDDQTIWIEVEYKGFNVVEMGSDLYDETFYLPTPKRLEKRTGKDWY